MSKEEQATAIAEYIEREASCLRFHGQHSNERVLIRNAMGRVANYAIQVANGTQGTDQDGKDGTA